MKRFKKGIATLLLGACVSIATAPVAFAKADAYLVKDSASATVYEYNKSVLNNGLVNYTVNGSDPYFEEFDGRRSKNSLYAIHSDSGKYVDFNNAKNALIEYTLQGKEFNLDTYLDLSTTPALNITNDLKEVTLENGQVKYVVKSNGDSLEIISIE